MVIARYSLHLFIKGRGTTSVSQGMALAKLHSQITLMQQIIPGLASEKRAPQSRS